MISFQRFSNCFGRQVTLVRCALSFYYISHIFLKFSLPADRSHLLIIHITWIEILQKRKPKNFNIFWEI